MSLPTRIKEYCPPALLGPLKSLVGRSTRYSAGYATWGEALASSSGYDSESVISRVVAATRKVLGGEAAYERDSVLFDVMDDPFQLLAPLLRAALESQGRLSVLDFGGSLGSTYRQCRSYLAPTQLTWNVVEQTAFVAAGKAEFETDELRFHDRPESVAADRPNVALFSSSLQYLEKPFEALHRAAGEHTRYLIIDRTPFTADASDHVCVQHVPRHIYACSYPLWVFAYEPFVHALQPRWSLISQYACPEGKARASTGLQFEYRGLVFRKNDAQ